ncbi:hypothetical protein ACP275_07G089800 [Erythranthe tilingii]
MKMCIRAAKIYIRVLFASERRLCEQIFEALFSVVGFSSSSAAAASDDYTSLVFKGCADQNIHDFNGLYKQTLETLLDDLTSKSSPAKFYKPPLAATAVSSSAEGTSRTKTATDA